MAQVSIDTTSLSSAVTTKTADSVVVVSATGAAAGNLLVVMSANGCEAMLIRSNYVSGTTIPVTRGVAGTRAMLHDANAQVFIGGTREFNAADPDGGYGATANVYALPWVNLRNGKVFELDSGNNWYEKKFFESTQKQTVTPDDSDGVGVNMIRPDATTVICGANVNGVNDYIVLPSLADVPDGHTITVIANAAGHEVRTPAASAEEINSEDCDGTKEYAIPSGNEVHIFYKINSTLGWMGAGWTAIGAKTTAVVPD